MRTAHHAHARRHGGGAHLVDAEDLERCGRADDVNDGVVPADLVEVDLIDRSAVQRGFHHRQLGEDRLGPCRHAGRQGGFFNECGDHAVGPNHHVVAADDGAGASDASPNTVLELERPPGKVQAVEERTHLVDIGPGVDQRPERHVTRDAGEAVEPCHRRGVDLRCRHGRRRAIAHAAPYPLSMPTTVIPDEQAESMASSAVTPSSAAP